MVATVNKGVADMQIVKIEGNMMNVGDKVIIHAIVEPEDVFVKTTGYVYVSVRSENDGYPMNRSWVNYKGGGE
jgi:hypothetical protein